MAPNQPITPPQKREDRFLEDEFGVSPLSIKDPIEAAIPHQRSTDSSSPRKTPSSVEVMSISSRDLSDLSESYAYGRLPRPRREPNAVPRNIYPSSCAQTATSSLDRPWRQAYVLSDVPPEQQHKVLPKPRWLRNNEKPKNLLKNASNISRFPLVILLMDPWQKQYELMQIWIDVSSDTVRDVLQSVRQQLPTKWNLDYDGLIERRGGRASLLINCVGIRQFEVVPYEIWIAKPWKMSKDRATRHGDVVLDHLKDIGVIHHASTSSFCGAITLSRAAQARIYAPEGIMTHHHARQFLTFVPPFEPLPITIVVEEETNGADANSVVSDSAVSHVSHTSLGLVKSYDSTCKEDCQEVVLGKKKMDWDCEDTATLQSSTAPLLHDALVERSDGSKQPTPTTKAKGRVGRIFTFVGLPKRIRKNRGPGLSKLGYNDSCETLELTDDEYAPPPNLFPIELDDDETRSVISSSAPLMICSSNEEEELAVVSVKTKGTGHTTARYAGHHPIVTL